MRCLVTLLLSAYKSGSHLGTGACTAAQEQEVLDKQTTTWEDIVIKHLPQGMEEEDWDEKDCRPAVGSQFEDTPVAVEVSKEEFMEESAVEEPPAEHVDEGHSRPWKPGCSTDSCRRG